MRRVRRRVTGGRVPERANGSSAAAGRGRVAARRAAGRGAFGAASLDAFGSFGDGEAVAACLALDYVRATQAGKLPRLVAPAPARRGDPAGNGRGHPRQPGDHPRARRRHRTHAAVGGAAHPDRAGRAAAGGMARRPAGRPGGDRPAAGWLVVAARQPPARRGLARGAARGAGHGTRPGPAVARARRPARPRRVRDGLGAAHAAAGALDGPLPALPDRWRTALGGARPAACTAGRGPAGHAARAAGRRRHRRRLRRRAGRRTRAARRQPPRDRDAAARVRPALRGRQPEDPAPRAARLRHRGAGRRGRGAARHGRS